MGFVVSACHNERGAAGSEELNASRTDSAGVEVIYNPAPIWGEEASWRIDSLPRAVIRTPDSPDPPFILHEVGDVVILSDERLVVENRGTAELLVFDGGGEYLETWGGRGEGPGEFESMRGLFRCGTDSLLVHETRRSTLLNGRGDVQGTWYEPSVAGVSTEIHAYGVASDCSTVLLGWHAGLEEDQQRGTLLQQFVLAWGSREGRLDTIAEVTRMELGGSGAEIPFSLMPDWDTDGERVVYGHGDIAELEVMDHDGGLDQIIRWEAQSTHISSEDWAAYHEGFDSLVAYAPDFHGERYTPRDLMLGTLPVFGRAWYGEGRRFMPGVSVDENGNIWIRRYRHASLKHRFPRLRYPLPSQDWWIMDGSGQWLGELATPENLSPRYLGVNGVVGVARDGLDREEIRVFEVHRE